jgi:glycosyltransferase involved in cell wall biosynthesis
MEVSRGSVWLDARGAQSVGHAERGVARYVTEHARALLEVAPELIGWIGLNPELALPGAARFLESSGRVALATSTALPERQPDIYHVMSPGEAELDLDEIWPPWSRSARLVITLHDLIPLLMRRQYNADWGHWSTAWIARLGLLGAAHQVLTNSQQTAADAVEHLHVPEERITVIGSGVSDRFSSLVADREEAEGLLRSARPKVRPGFLLYVGGLDYRKNLDGAVRAYARLPRQMRDAHQLVIVCKLPHHRRVSLRAFALGLGIESRNLLLTGFVSDRELAALYRSCELFVFPSLYEGAGLPILEAMSCGAPIAASGVSAMPEVLGDPRATFDPADPADIAHCVRELLDSPALLDALRRSSREQSSLHTWERVARRTVEGFERALDFPLEPARFPAPLPRLRRRVSASPSRLLQGA